MGVSTDAILFYGYCWDEEPDFDLDYWYDFEGPVQRSTHCSAEHPIPYVTVAESRITASRGSPEEVKSLAVKPEWKEQLDAFLKELSIKPPQPEPRWWLVSDWA